MAGGKQFRMRRCRPLLGLIVMFVLSFPSQSCFSNYSGKVAKTVTILKEDVPCMMTSINGWGARAPRYGIYSDDIIFIDHRLPVAMHGKPAYQRFLSAMRWTIRSLFEESRMEIVSMGRTLTNGQLSVRWRLHLWPKGLIEGALQFFAGSLHNFGWSANSHESEAPFIVEGYSQYEFDPWTAEVTRHTVDIKNPPMLLFTDLLKQYSTPEVTAVPAGMAFQFAGNTAGGAAETNQRSATAATKNNWPVPESCEDDFDCNDGQANFPLQCCELPLLGKFCCKPPDDPSPDKKDPAWLPLPVPSDG